VPADQGFSVSACQAISTAVAHVNVIMWLYNWNATVHRPKNLHSLLACPLCSIMSSLSLNAGHGQSKQASRRLRLAAPVKLSPSAVAFGRLPASLPSSLEMWAFGSTAVPSEPAAQRAPAAGFRLEPRELGKGSCSENWRYGYGLWARAELTNSMFD